MEASHARYPFLPAARAAVAEADADLLEVVEAGGPVLERARERVEAAIESRGVGEPHRSERVELLSYPVARVLVSLLDEPALTRRYASAEATTAVERLRADGEAGTPLRSVGGERRSRGAFLEALELAEAVDLGGDRAEVDVAAYLRLTDELRGDRWRLVGRRLHDGRVPVTEAEFWELLRAAVQARVAEDLPLSVPEAIAEALTETVVAVRAQLADFSVDRSFGAVDPAAYPPCIVALEERVEAGEPMAPHSWFAYVSFLGAIGVERTAIEDTLAGHPDVDETLAGARLDHLLDRDGSAYLPPSCATMQAYGDCVDQDALCARIGHPLEYYERRLDGDDPADYASRVESQ